MNRLFLKKDTSNTLKENVELSNEGIDRLSELLVDALAKMQMSSKDILRLRLAVEDILLMWKEHITSPSVCSFVSGKHFGRPYIQILLPGAEINPATISAENEDDVFYSALLAQSGISPVYDYVHGVNRLSFAPPKHKASSIKVLLLTVCIAIALGTLCRYLPLGINSLIAELTDLFLSTLTGIFSAIAGPLVFFSIIVGIINTGDFASFKRIGKTLSLRILSAFFIILFIVTSCSVWLFLGEGDTSVSSSDSFVQILKIILDIIPNNLFAPFVSGNTLQIIFIAICVGIATLVLDNKIALVKDFFIQTDKLIKLLIEFLGSNINILIFISVFSIALSLSFDGIGALILGLCVATVFNILCPIAYTFVASLKLQISFPKLLKKLMPAYLLALMTASSSASLSTVFDTCEKKLGIHRRIVSFAIPLTQIILCPGSSIGLMLMILGLSRMYSVSISLPWLLIIFLAVFLLAIATPPIPGGGIAIMTVLLAQAGIPTSAITIALAYELISDHFSTSCNIACMQAEVLLSADKLGMVDRDILLS